MLIATEALSVDRVRRGHRLTGPYTHTHLFISVSAYLSIYIYL